MNKVAVIMSVYLKDSLPYVVSAVNSILEQTYVSFDFFIIEDGRLDPDVDAFLSGIGDERVILQKREQNRGLAKSMNELLDKILALKYEYIARMDADDISMPERFAKQFSFMEKHKQVDCVGTWAVEINEVGSIFYRKKMPESHSDCYKLFQKRDCLVHPTVLFRKRFFEKAGLYPEDTYYAEDTMMWANGFATGCIFANIPEYLYKFRLDKDFFKRRRGWKHAIAIYKLRRRVNKKLNYPMITNLYAIMYAVAKMMPTFILNIIYKVSR
jgi:glycosyltransferase involved in cell wall biosynthesis